MIAAPFSTLRQYGGVVIFDNHYRRASRLRGSALASEARDLSGNRFLLSEVGCAGRRGRRRLAQIAPRRARSVIRPTARFRPGLTCQIPGPAKSRPFCQRFVVALRTSPEDVQDCRRLRTTLIGMLSSATASAFVRSVGCARRSISIWPIAGAVDWGSTPTSPIIRRFQRTVTVVSARAIFCASCSRRRAA
jgi:hypothetical protein